MIPPDTCEGNFFSLSSIAYRPFPARDIEKGITIIIPSIKALSTVIDGNYVAKDQQSIICSQHSSDLENVQVSHISWDTNFKIQQYSMWCSNSGLTGHVIKRYDFKCVNTCRSGTIYYI